MKERMDGQMFKMTRIKMTGETPTKENLIDPLNVWSNFWKRSQISCYLYALFPPQKYLICILMILKYYLSSCSYKCQSWGSERLERN